MKEYRYTIVLHPVEEGNGFWVEVPALPGCYAQGDTFDEAVALAKEAIEEYIAVAVELGKPVPVEDQHTLSVVVEVAA